MKRWMDNLRKKIADNPEAAGGELVSMEQEPEALEPKQKKQNVLARFRRESKRDRQLAALTDGYQQMVSLMGSIQLHLESQTKSQQHLLNAMENLPEVADGLKKMGSAAEKQTEVMGLMREQLDSSVQHDQQLVDSMKRFNKTLAAMNFIFLLLLLGGLSAGIYFGLGDSAKSSLMEKAKGLFNKQPAPVEEVREAPSASGDEPVEAAASLSEDEPVSESGDFELPPPPVSPGS